MANIPNYMLDIRSVTLQSVKPMPRKRQTPSSATWRQASHLVQGDLATLLLNGYRQGMSHERIARQLFTDHGVIVSSRTVGNWLHQLNGTGLVRSA